MSMPPSPTPKPSRESLLALLLEEGLDVATIDAALAKAGYSPLGEDEKLLVKKPSSPLAMTGAKVNAGAKHPKKPKQPQAQDDLESLNESLKALHEKSKEVIGQTPEGKQVTHAHHAFVSLYHSLSDLAKAAAPDLAAQYKATKYPHGEALPVKPEDKRKAYAQLFEAMLDRFML
jgi:hypothetical protein